MNTAVFRRMPNIWKYNIRADLLISDIALDLPESRWKNNKDLSLLIIQYVNSNRSSKGEEVSNNFKKLLIWMRDYEEEQKRFFRIYTKNKHYLYDEQILDDIKQAGTLKNLMQKCNVSSPEKLEELLAQTQIQPAERDNEKIELTQDVLLQLGIDSEEVLNTVFNNVEFASKYIRTSKHDTDTYEYVRTILERSKKIFSRI